MINLEESIPFLLISLRSTNTEVSSSSNLMDPSINPLKNSFVDFPEFCIIEASSLAPLT